MVAKLAHANPMTVLRTIVHQVKILSVIILIFCFQFFGIVVFVRKQLLMGWYYVQIEAYKDMITPVVDAFKYLTQVRIFYFVMLNTFILPFSSRILLRHCF